jgi:hypothetical protein
VVFIEGDCPVDGVDLTVFVAPPLPPGASLIRRVTREHAEAHRAKLLKFTRALDTHEVVAGLLGADFGEAFVAMAMQKPEMLEDLRTSMQAKLKVVRDLPPPSPTEHWGIADGYEGIERAQLVVVNARSGDDHERADALVEEVARIRKDAAVFRDVLHLSGNKLPVTAVVADVTKEKDAGMKKAVARLKRAIKQVRR